MVETLACGRPVLISNQVNIWREIKGAGAALVQDSSLAGTKRLFEDWLALTAEARSAMPTSVFRKHFSMESATRNLISTIA